MSNPFLIDYLFELRWSICLAGIFTIILLWTLKPKKELKYLWIVLFIGIFTQSRFGTLHNGFFLHDHDCIHYQLGSKYFKEFGYNGIYAGLTKALRELSEKYPEIKAPEKFRDLDNKTGEHLNYDHPKAQRIRDKFTDQRWEEFKTDIMSWERKYTPDWQHMVRDAGYNPPPTWTIWGIIANYLIYPQNSVLYGIPDLIVLGIIFHLLWVTFSPRAALYSFSTMMFFPGGPFAPFDWVGGSLFRFLWILWMTLGLVYYQRKQYRLAGFMLALAAMERIFPAAWLASAGLISLFYFIQMKKTQGWAALQPLKGITIGAIISIASVLILSHLLLGIGTWGDFINHIKEHGSYLFTNHIGWTRAITFHPRMGEMGFNPENMSIFNDWNEILLKRKDWLVYVVLRLLFALAIVYWAWQSIARSTQTLAIAWMGAGIVFFASMPAHYYLVGLLPILGITAAQSPKMFIGCLITIAVINAITQMSETLGWALASIAMAVSAAYGLGYSIAKTQKINTALTSSGIVLFLIVFFPSLHSDPVKNHTKAELKPLEDTRTLNRSFLIKEGYEVHDKGFILLPNKKIEIKTVTNSNHKLYIRSDRYFKGKLVLKDLNGNIIYTWDVQPRGNMFDTLVSDPLPNLNRYILEWQGEEKTDIGIFSIWTQ